MTESNPRRPTCSFQARTIAVNNIPAGALVPVLNGDDRASGCVARGRSFCRHARVSRQILFPSEHGTATERRRGLQFSVDEILEGGAASGALQYSRLIVKPLERLHFFFAPELGLLQGGLQHADGLVVDFDRDGVGMAILAFMRGGRSGPDRQTGTARRA